MKTYIAKIVRISPKVIAGGYTTFCLDNEGYLQSHIEYDRIIEHDRMLKEYAASYKEWEVENAFKNVKTAIGKEPKGWTVNLLKDGFNYYPELKINQSCEIEETGEGKCKIIKFNT